MQPSDILFSNDPALHPVDTKEHDACALICSVRKGGQATHGNVKRTIEALARMGHRTGIVEGEGDGVGILTDIPAQLWTKRLAQVGLRPSLASSPNFWVAHLLIPAEARGRSTNLVEQICNRIAQAGLEILTDHAGKVNPQVLGPSAEKNEPVFWQIAGLNGEIPYEILEQTLFNLQVQIEHDLNIHFASFSSRSVVYKVQGTVEILRRYYPELRDPDYASTVTLGHARYSTNTNPIFERVQPFGILGHNGEFNTISRFRIEAGMLGIPLAADNSDSQDIDRVLHTLCMDFGLDLIEAMELVFPPYSHDLIQNAPEIHDVYDNMRQVFGPFAQGPSAVAARLEDYCVFSVDALGLRPLWFGETEKEYFATSERGVYPLDMMSSDPKPLAPGEKIALRITPGRPIEVLDHAAIQRHVVNRHRERQLYHHTSGNSWLTDESQQKSKSPLSTTHPIIRESGATPTSTTLQVEVAPAVVTKDESHKLHYEIAPQYAFKTPPWREIQTELNAVTMTALGWERFHSSFIEVTTDNNKEQIGSLGWDGPLAAISQTRINLADFFKETVAVVTNPAIDRQRERAQFSTKMLIGVRPQIGRVAAEDDLLVQIETPLLLGGHPNLGTDEAMHVVANQHGTMTLDDIFDTFKNKVAWLSMSASPDESIDQALERLQHEAVNLVLNGIQCLILDDTDIFDGNRLWIDPLLVTAAVDRALRFEDYPENLRRKTGIVVRSGALRDLHDLTMTVALGANAIVPYAMYAVALKIAPRAAKNSLTSEEKIERLSNLISILTAGFEKVTSTIGGHELRGFGHSFSAIGLATNVAEMFDVPNYFGSEARGLTWSDLRDDAEERAAELRGEKKGKLGNPDRFYPKMWKKVEAIAHGELSLEDYTHEMIELENSKPVAIRHILGFKPQDSDIDPDTVDITIKHHAMPMVISAMSFGSQGELAYKAYAEAAYKLNIICINGEGGELPDIMGRYPRNRGQQIASGRFGVDIDFLNSVELLEIKIGQGAKPGEGGHLPGFKVTEQVAAARHTAPGIDLISPSNNHDLYSIEDLAQLIDELKTANPKARVSVKLPVVPGIGIIAVGVAKAGADIITLTGYDGATGAARVHALRHVGLPAEIGVWLAHRALIESGIRDQVEIWCDGGIKSGRDVVKMICLGANRAGLATIPMVAVGCTICRKCQEGTCHVGITTHIKTKEEALLKGIKHFEPRIYDEAVENISTVFHILADDIRETTAKLGFTRTQDLVGRADLLKQVAMHDQIDLSKLTRRVPNNEKRHIQPGVGRRLTRPRNTLTKQITALIAEQAEYGEKEMTYDDEQVMAMDRALGTHLVGALVRADFPNADMVEAVHLSFSNSAIPGNGLAAFLDAPIDVLVEGGGQDGIAKSAKGGAINILKGLNHNGQRLDGSVGKSFAYGARGGLFIVQGNADTRACIRLSGADVIFGGEVKEPLRDELGGIGSRANLKGYACEYMTSGRVLILGDPGPWICAGMTGGVIYQRIQPEMNLTVDAIRRRIAEGAIVDIFSLEEHNINDVHELLNSYIQTLELNNQAEAVQHLYPLLARPQDHFVKLTPVSKKH
ncbi:MAG: glutamate synthase [Phototrophicales bacterium]|nr:MAG: glutamate synthase [Phototrophicales bacterium]